MSQPIGNCSDLFVTEVQNMIEDNKESMPSALYENFLKMVGVQKTLQTKYSFHILRIVQKSGPPTEPEIKSFQHEVDAGILEKNINPDPKKSYLHHIDISINKSKVTSFPIHKFLFEKMWFLENFLDGLLENGVIDSVTGESMFSNPERVGNWATLDAFQASALKPKILDVIFDVFDEIDYLPESWCMSFGKAPHSPSLTGEWLSFGMTGANLTDSDISLKPTKLNAVRNTSIRTSIGYIETHIMNMKREIVK